MDTHNLQGFAFKLHQIKQTQAHFRFGFLSSGILFPIYGVKNHDIILLNN